MKSVGIILSRLVGSKSVYSHYLHLSEASKKMDVCGAHAPHTSIFLVFFFPG